MAICRGGPYDSVSGIEAQMGGAGLFFEQLPTCPVGGADTLGGYTLLRWRPCL